VPRLFILLPAVVLASLSAGFYGQGQAAEATDPPELRLSGTVIISEARRHAILEYRDGSSRKVVPGDHIAGWGRVAAIGHEQITFQIDGAERTAQLTGGSGFRSLADFPASAEVPEVPPHIGLQSTPEFITEVSRLARQPASTVEDLNNSGALGLLDLPLTARIVAIDHESLSRGRESLRRIKDALTAGTVVRLSLEDAGPIETVYLSPPDSP
jgi:hypothetical protein